MHALRPGGHAIIATFAPDGPDRCDGLPVTRSSADELLGLLGLLGGQFTSVTSVTHIHHTPTGCEQPFTWLTVRTER
jgi:hypothetical protein